MFHDLCGVHFRNLICIVRFSPELPTVSINMCALKWDFGTFVNSLDALQGSQTCENTAYKMSSGFSECFTNKFTWQNLEPIELSHHQIC